MTTAAVSDTVTRRGGPDENARLDTTESSGGASKGARLIAWRASQGREGLKASGVAARAKERRRLAICAATRAAVAAGAYEIPPRAGSLGARRALDALLGETAEGRSLLAEAERHTGSCMKRVPGRPPIVECSCSGQAAA